MAAGLAVTAAALVAAGPRDATGHPRGGPARGHPGRTADASPGHREGPGADADRTVTVPVRLADAATVRLLRPGDRVDVIAVEDPDAGGRTRVVARGARVTTVPRPVGGRRTDADTRGTDGSAGSGAGMGPGTDVSPAGAGGGDDALVALAVPRSTAARLAGAAATTRLAVTLW